MLKKLIFFICCLSLAATGRFSYAAEDVPGSSPASSSLLVAETYYETKSGVHEYEKKHADPVFST